MQTTISGAVITRPLPAGTIGLWGEADRHAGYPLCGSGMQAAHMLPEMVTCWWPSEIAHPWLWHGLFYPFGDEHPAARIGLAFALHTIA